MIKGLVNFIKKNKLNNQGSTMVEVLVGFTILVAVLVECMVHIVGVSNDMVLKSIDIQKAQMILNSEIYRKDIEDSYDEISGVSITLKINEEKTNVSANNANTTTSIALNAKLKKYYSEATDLNVFKLFFDGE